MHENQNIVKNKYCNITLKKHYNIVKKDINSIWKFIEMRWNEMNSLK